ncbi:carbon-nitrogen hydrolase family protein [Catellatospora sp. TT07R-123]|uniref:carbon-nitrogen hydrolase family protein n=1 Tax=Catellatospora sp. TT07R-123 TaxID=2733863 RepID=UPI001BB372E5|nr:nitrilase-related carbon-nitrogen hydrolase [Catellatospora sp. TT07R-123]
MSIMIAQVPVVWSIDANLGTVQDVLGEAASGDVVILPEGMLSGYGEDLAPLDRLDPAEVNDAVAQVARLAVRRQAHVFCGSLLPQAGGWCNAGLFFPADGSRHQVYRKINLAMNERGRLLPGDALPTVDVPHRDGTVTAGMQLCREIRFPEQWQHLATAGAKLFVYLTNAANTREPEGVWRSHLISRAAENQRFLASANIAHPDQHCPSMVVSPRGEVLGELAPGRTGLLRHVLDSDEAGNWYLGQRRQDVLSLHYHRSGSSPTATSPARRPRPSPARTRTSASRTGTPSAPRST